MVSGRTAPRWEWNVEGIERRGALCRCNRSHRGGVPLRRGALRPTRRPGGLAGASPGGRARGRESRRDPGGHGACRSPHRVGLRAVRHAPAADRGARAASPPADAGAVSGVCGGGVPHSLRAERDRPLPPGRQRCGSPLAGGQGRRLAGGGTGPVRASHQSANRPSPRASRFPRLCSTGRPWWFHSLRGVHPSPPSIMPLSRWGAFCLCSLPRVRCATMGPSRTCTHTVHIASDEGSEGNMRKDRTWRMIY